MISDVLSDAVEWMDDYRIERHYYGDLAVRIKRLRDEMDAMREELDRSGSAVDPVDGHSS